MNKQCSESELNILKLVYIRDNVELMNKFNHVEVLRLLSKDKNIILNENKNGVHINLSELSSDIIEELTKYINYIKIQENSLNKDELQKENFKNIYFSDDF